MDNSFIKNLQEKILLVIAGSEEVLELFWESNIGNLRDLNNLIDGKISLKEENSSVMKTVSDNWKKLQKYIKLAVQTNKPPRIPINLIQVHFIIKDVKYYKQQQEYDHDRYENMRFLLELYNILQVGTY